MGLSEAEKAALREIQSEGTESQFTGRTKLERPKTPFYKLLNCSPNATDKERAAFKPGIRISEDCIAQSIRAVILYTSDGRKLVKKVGGKFATTCCSYDGESPAPKIAAPECNKLTSEGLVNILSKFKGYDKAKIEAKVAELTEDNALAFCSIKTANGFIPMCPKARWNEDAGTSGPCKPLVHLFGFDIERQTVFKMELTGRSIASDKRFTSPLALYRKWLGQKRVNCYAFTVELSPAKDGAFYHLNVENYTPIIDAEERARMKAMAHETYERFQRNASWTPSKQSEEGAEEAPQKTAAPAPKVAPKATGREDDYVGTALGEDDLPDDVSFD